MDPEMFHELLIWLTSRLTKAYTNYRKALEPDLKLAVTLHFMATGDNFRDLAYAYRMPHNTISMFLGDVCQAIVAEYGCQDAD